MPAFGQEHFLDPTDPVDQYSILSHASVHGHSSLFGICAIVLSLPELGGYLGTLRCARPVVRDIVPIKTGLSSLPLAYYIMMWLVDVNSSIPATCTFVQHFRTFLIALRVRNLRHQVYSK